MHETVQTAAVLREWGGGWCVLICSCRRQLADRHLPPFALKLTPQRRWCPPASHHLVPFLSPLGLSFRYLVKLSTGLVKLSKIW